MTAMNNNRRVPTDGGALPNDVSIVFSNDDAGCTCGNPNAGRSNQEKELKKETDNFLMVWWVRFVPALMLYPIWAATLHSNQIWTVTFTTYWPATLGMVLGSFLAGSTPLGGGVVAFPIAVLVLNFDAEESRDAAILVQAVGMNAAAFLLAATKPELLDARLILVSSVGGTIGIVAGMIWISAASNVVNLVYTLAVFEFGLVFWFINTFRDSSNGTTAHASNAECVGKDAYLHAEFTSDLRTASVTSGLSISVFNPTYYSGESESDSEVPPLPLPPLQTSSNNGSTSTSTVRQPGSSTCNLNGGNNAAKISNDSVDYTGTATVLILVAATLGGFVTSKVGSGSDIAMFVAGIFGWNTLCPSKKLGDAKLTASSVVVMGILSAVASILRALTGEFSTRVLHCWGAMACIVVIGAPLGSFVLSPKATPYLRMLFYLLAVVQLVLFGALKIKDDATQWLAIGIVTAAVVALLVASKQSCCQKLAV